MLTYLFVYNCLLSFYCFFVNLAYDSLTIVFKLPNFISIMYLRYTISCIAGFVYINA